MANLENDIKYVNSILNYQVCEEFSFLYSRTNEDLTSLFSKIDVKGKDIYANLSSSDLLFSLLYKGAKKVDCFDIFPITYRYYYFRKWLLQYGLIDADGRLLSELSWIVNSIHPSNRDEEESKLFWQDCLSKIKDYHLYSSVLFEYVRSSNVPYSENLNVVVEILKTIQLKFDNIDICSNISIDPNRRYDMVFMSNILKYNRALTRLETVCKNLINLLKNNGSVICVNMPIDSPLSEEKAIFLKYFDFDEILEDNCLYYRYTKK